MSFIEVFNREDVVSCSQLCSTEDLVTLFSIGIDNSCYLRDWPYNRR